MRSPEKLKRDVLADGKIDADEVDEIRSVIYADGTIDSDEVDFLFALNDAVSGKANAAGWKDLFVEAVASNILEDGVIDEEETAYLLDKIQGDGTVDDVEKALLEKLKSSVGSLPEALEKLITG